MVVALGLACAGCQTMGPEAETNSRSAMVRLVADKAQKHQVPPSLATAVVKVESGFNPRAYSRGNYGLGQIRCGTARGVGFSGSCRDLLDPEINLEYSMAYLRQAYEAADGDWCGTANKYNGGLGARMKRNRYCKKVLHEASDG